jgi:hypothetical protein
LNAYVFHASHGIPDYLIAYNNDKSPASILPGLRPHAYTDEQAAVLHYTYNRCMVWQQSM